MDNIPLKNSKFLYKSFNNDNNEKEEFEKEIIENKLSIRKRKLYQILQQKRKINSLNSNTEDKNQTNQLSQVSILIQREGDNDIQSGLNIFYNYLINNEKLDKETKEFILENIYYRLLDILLTEKSFDNNKHMSKIFFLINYLTTESNAFIGPLTENFFLTQFKNVIELNINNNNFINEIIPILSDMLINKKKFVQIMNEIDIIKVMKIKMGQNIIDKDNMEHLLLLMNNFILNINQDKTNKFAFILEYVLNILKKIDEKNMNIINNEESLILISIFDILIHMSNNQENLKIIKNNNCIQFLKDMINNSKSNNAHSHILKCYELFSNIIKNTNGSNEKKDIITYIYQGNVNGFPFVNELIKSIKSKNKSFIYILLNNITSLIYNNDDFCELYCSNNDFINILLNLFPGKTSKRIKNEIIIFFINVLENNNIKIYKYLLNTNIFQIFITYISKKTKSKNESTKIIIYNILYFINKCLLIDEENNIKEIIKILSKYKFKEIVEEYIENKDESISDISRTIFIKFFSGPENFFHNNNIKNNKDTQDNKDDMIIE